MKYHSVQLNRTHGVNCNVQSTNLVLHWPSQNIYPNLPQPMTCILSNYNVNGLVIYHSYFNTQQCSLFCTTSSSIHPGKLELVRLRVGVKYLVSPIMRNHYNLQITCPVSQLTLLLLQNIIIIRDYLLGSDS